MAGRLAQLTQIGEGGTRDIALRSQLMEAIRKALTRVGVWTAHPTAFLIWAAYVAAWIWVEPHTLDWHAAAALATWLMTLFIQRAEHRDTQAIHAKLDEVLKALGDARTDMRDIDDQEPEEIERQRESERAP